MQNDRRYNKRIICIDDEEVMLDTYQAVLAPDDKDFFTEILHDSEQGDLPQKTSTSYGRLKNFDIVLAKSGEEALVRIKEEMAEGKRFAAGFFDMRMPGGMDGFETIRLVRELDPQILCAVVTAYTDRSVEQIAELFNEEDQDQLLYFNKPFRTAELRQTAVNMVSSWNRKRNEEEQFRIIEKNRVGLQCILDAITKLLWIPPRPLHTMLCGILYQSLALIHAEDGYIGVFDEENRLVIGHALGKFEDKVNSVATITDAHLQTVLKEKKVFIEDRLCMVPLIYSERHLGLIYMESKQPIIKNDEENILSTFGAQMVPLIRNSMFYEELLQRDQVLMTDPLTGLYNRYAIYRILEKELSRTLRYSFSFAILMVELENLQSLTTAHGQSAVDHIIKDLSDLLRQTMRSYDIVGRNVDTQETGSQAVIPYNEGGFFILLAQTDEQGAKEVTTRILDTLGEYSYCDNGNTVALSFRLGFAVDSVNREKIEDAYYIAGIIQKTRDNQLTIHTGQKDKDTV